MKSRISLLRPVFALLALLAVLAAALTVGATQALFSDSESIRARMQAGIWCTYTLGYWKNHPDAWPVQEITVGGITYARSEAITILQTSPRGDATRILTRQLITAKLNVLRGADPNAVGTTIADADVWLAAHPLGSDPSNPERQQGISFSVTLDEYNNGEIGPGHCGD